MVEGDRRQVMKPTDHIIHISYSSLITCDVTGKHVLPEHNYIDPAPGARGTQVGWAQHDLVDQVGTTLLEQLVCTLPYPEEAHDILKDHKHRLCFLDGVDNREKRFCAIIVQQLGLIGKKAESFARKPSDIDASGAQAIQWDM